MKPDIQFAAVTLAIVMGCGEQAVVQAPSAANSPVAPSVPAVAAPAAPVASPPLEGTVSFVYADLSTDSEIATAVTLRVLSTATQQIALPLGRFEGTCSSRRYEELGRVSPAPIPVTGTVCEIAGTSTIAIIREGDHLIASVQDQGDGVERDPRTGRELGPQRASTWRELGRIVVPASLTLRVVQ